MNTSLMQIYFISNKETALVILLFLQFLVSFDGLSHYLYSIKIDLFLYFLAKMTTLFARVVKQALITFERENHAAFKTNFSLLKQLVDQLSSSDLNIPSELLSRNSFQYPSAGAPVKYIEIFEHKTFTMSVFIVANNYCMPLHDHPGYGLLRVLSGTAFIQSYTLEQPLQKMPHILPVIEEMPMEFSAKSGCSVLTPTIRNLHEIAAIGSSPAAFFDILSPPYESEISANGPKKCLFYRKIAFKPSTDSTTKSSPDADSDTSKSKDIAYLQRVGAPNHYFCDNIFYANQPAFLTNLNLLNSVDEGTA